MGAQTGSSCFWRSNANPIVGEWELATAPRILAIRIKVGFGVHVRCRRQQPGKSEGSASFAEQLRNITQPLHPERPVQAQSVWVASCAPWTRDSNFAHITVG